MTKDQGVTKLQVIKKTQEHRCVRQAFDFLPEACSHVRENMYTNCKTVNTGKAEWNTVSCW